MIHKRLSLTIFTLAAMVAGALTYHAAPASALTCSVLPDSICNKAESKDSNPSNNGTFALLIAIIQILTAGVGIAATGALVYAGVLYASAGGTADQVSKAKKIITDTVIGLIVFGLMFLLLNFLIPGGVLG